MKRCPRCEKTYPDAETFCETDGTALVQAGPAFAESAGRRRGQPNRVSGMRRQGAAGRADLQFLRRAARRRVAQLSTYTPPPAAHGRRATDAVRRDPSPSMRITGKMPEGDDDEDEGRSTFGVLAYMLAAVVALGGGAWLALHLSTKGAEAPVANASPSAAASVALPCRQGRWWRWRMRWGCR